MLLVGRSGTLLFECKCRCGQFHFILSLWQLFKRTEQNRTDQNRTEQNRTEQNRTEQNRTEQNRTEQNRTEQNRTEQNRTEQNRITLIFYKKQRSMLSAQVS